MNNISLQELIAYNNTPKAKALIVRYGYKPARSYNDLIHKLVQFTREHREDALKEMAEIHPHKDLILNYLQTPVSSEPKSNCDGDTMCSVCKAKQQYISFEGTNGVQNTQNNNTQTKPSEALTWLPMVAIVGLVISTLVLANRK